MVSDVLNINNLSLEEKIAQLFIMGFKGSNISDESTILHTVKNYKPGGLILFDRDMVHHRPVHNIKSPEQVKLLCNTLQDASELPLLLGIDQEGGLINRLKPEYGFPETKSHQFLGDRNDTEITKKEGMVISEMLAKAGLNLNFAPVVDLNSNTKSSIISKRERSFGAEVSKVVKHARAYIKAHQMNNVITCCKHFPGHGSAEGDTHAGFVDVTNSWTEEELEPYKKLIAEEMCPMIMTAHIFNANLDSELPATLSKKVITELLRGTLNFEGVIISDDMQMKAISDHYDLKKSLELGLLAGLDMFCFGNNLLKQTIDLPNAIEAIKELIHEGVVTQNRINESVERILKLKTYFN